MSLRISIVATLDRKINTGIEVRHRISTGLAQQHLAVVVLTDSATQRWQTDVVQFSAEFLLVKMTITWQSTSMDRPSSK